MLLLWVSHTSKYVTKSTQLGNVQTLWSLNQMSSLLVIYSEGTRL